MVSLRVATPSVKFIWLYSISYMRMIPFCSMGGTIDQFTLIDVEDRLSAVTTSGAAEGAVGGKVTNSPTNSTMKKYQLEVFSW